MAASIALSTPMILNSHSHNNACDQPQHFTVIKPPWHAQFIIHFALSHCSQKDLRVALVLVCEEALWHPAWCTFHGSHSCPTWGERREERTPAHKCGQFGLRLTPSALNKWSKCSPEIVLPLPPLSDGTGGGNTPPVALWWPARMNMRKWGRHPVNNSCHRPPRQAAGPGVGWMGGGASVWYARAWHGTQTQSCHPCGNITLASTICALNTSVGTWQVLISPHWLFPLTVMPPSPGHTRHLVWMSVHDAARCKSVWLHQWYFSHPLTLHLQPSEHGYSALEFVCVCMCSCVYVHDRRIMCPGPDWGNNSGWEICQPRPISTHSKQTT